MHTYLSLVMLTAAGGIAVAQDTAYEPNDSTCLSTELEEVVVSSRGQGIRKLDNVATNTGLITSAELKRAACCNLGESFTTNPSVDVNYSDATTGARQIRLLGLSGTYVQMLTENIPNLRGAAAPYGLGYIAGPWMQSIQVSKGASSVKNGYESITGQINIELKKPQLDPSISVNMYYDMMNKFEANVDGNLKLSDRWSTGALVHYENAFSGHDSDDDGFIDVPQVRQISLMDRWAYIGTDYIFQAAAKFIDERRTGGQTEHHAGNTGMPLYKTGIDTRRWEVFAKNAYIFDHDNDGNVALILSGSLHDQNAAYGLRLCDVNQREFYGSLMFERKWNAIHALSAGLSGNYDHYRYDYRLTTNGITPERRMEHEAVGGIYAQYTLNLDGQLIAMAGLRYDYSDLYHSLVTPRLHVRWNPNEMLSFNASAGSGARSPHPLAEYNYLLASSRRIEIEAGLQRESALNMGAGATVNLEPWDRHVALSAEYYYTGFSRQLTVDLDTDPHAAIISTPKGNSFSHAIQVELTAEPVNALTLTAAWRYTDVKVNYGYGTVSKPLTSRHKGLLTISYAPDMGLWQFDTTIAINGGGRMPTPYTLSSGELSWSPTYKAYPQLSAQITRNFRHWAIYIGGENLTNFRQRNHIIGSDNPWGDNFDATMVYGPLQGAMVYAGFRFNITKYL